MKAIVVTNRAAGTAGAKLVERPEPQAAINDVVVQTHASAFTGDELAWPSTWTDRGGRETALDFGAQEFVDLDNDGLEDVGEVDLVFDVIGGDIGKRSAGLIRAGGTLVTVTGPTEARPSGGRTIDFVVVPDRAQLSELVQRVRVGRLRTNIGNVAAVDDAVAAFNRTERIQGKA